MMDILQTIYSTVGFVVSMGILAIIPALYVATFLKRIPWMISAPAMVLVAGLVAYPMGMTDGGQKERLSWEIEIHNLRSALAAKKHQAELAGREIERKYLQSEREKSTLRQGRDDTLVRMMRAIPPHIESQNNDTKSSKAQTCNPYDMPAWPSILRNIKER